MEDRCCSHHFSDPGVSDHISSGLVDGSPKTSHFAGGYFALYTFGQGPCLALVGQGGDEDGVNESGFGLDGDVGMFEEWGKLIGDAVCLLYSCHNLSVETSVCRENTSELLELTDLL